MKKEVREILKRNGYEKLGRGDCWVRHYYGTNFVSFLTITDVSRWDYDIKTHNWVDSEPHINLYIRFMTATFYCLDDIKITRKCTKKAFKDRDKIALQIEKATSIKVRNK